MGVGVEESGTIGAVGRSVCKACGRAVGDSALSAGGDGAATLHAGSTSVSITSTDSKMMGQYFKIRIQIWPSGYGTAGVCLPAYRHYHAGSASTKLSLTALCRILPPHRPRPQGSASGWRELT